MSYFSRVRILRSIFAFVVFVVGIGIYFSSASSAQAATKYAIAAGGNWSATGTWSNVSSASAGGDGVPTAADDVVLDAGSGAVTIDAASVARSLNATGYTNILTHNAFTLSIGDATAGAGNVALKLVSGMTYTLGNATTSAISFISTSATVQTVDFAGKTTGNVTYNATSNGSWQMTGTHDTGTTATVTLTKGTLDTNGQTMSIGKFDSSNTNVRTLTLGASAITITASASAGTPWNLGTTTNLTFTDNTASITYNGGGSGVTNFAGGGLSYGGTVSFISGGSPRITGTNTFANLTRTGPTTKITSLVLYANQTVTGTLTLTGDSTTNRIVITSDTIGTARTIINTGATMTWSNVDFRDITLGTAFDASAITGLSGDAGGNSGITFTTAQTNYWIGGTGSWSTAGEWSTTSGGAADGRVPLPQDDAVFDANSFSAGSQTVTQDMPRAGKNINWTGVTNTPTWTTSTAASIFGSLTLVSGMTLTTSSQTYTFEGRSTYTLTNAGKTWEKNISMDAPGGTLTLQDDLTIGNGSLTLNNGSFDANNFNFTARGFVSTNSNTRTLTMGSGTWTITYNGNAWNIITATNLTLNADTSTIKFTDTTTTGINFYGGDQTYNNIWWSRGASTADNVVRDSSNTFNDFKDDGSAAHSLLFTAGKTQTVTTFTVSGTAGNVITINSLTTATHALTKSGGGVISSDYLNIQHSVASPSSTWYAGLNSTDNQATSTAGSGWNFSVPTDCTSLATGNWNTAGTWDCGHVPTTSDTATIAAGHTVTMDADSAVLGAMTVNGTLNTSDGTSRALSGTTLTIGAAGTLTANASTITLSSTTGTAFTNSGTFTPGTSTIAYTGNNGSGDTTVPALSYYNLTVNNASETYVLAGDTTVSNNLTIAAGTLDASASNYALSVGGTWSNSGTFTPRSGTVTLTGTSTFSDTTSFYNVTINGSGETVTLGAALTATNNLTITAGTLDVSASNYGVSAGIWSNSGTFTPRSGTLTLTGTGTFTDTTSFYNVTVNGSTKTVTLGAALTATNNLTITAGTLDVSASSYGIAIGGNFSNAGTFTKQSGTVTFNKSSSTQTLNSGGSSFYSITHSGAGTLQLTTSTLTITSALTNSAGIFDLNGISLTATGATISNTATIQAQGGETITGFTNDSTHGTVLYVGSGTYTSLNLGDTYNNITFNNLTVGGTDRTLNNDLTVNGNLTITAGLLTDAGFAIAIGGNWSNAGAYAGTGTVTFNASSGTQTVTSGGTGANQDFQNITKSGGGTLQLATYAVDIDGTLTINTSTIVDINALNIAAATLVNNGTLLADGSETMTITTKDTDSGLIKYDGSGSYLTALSYGNTYYDLEFAGTGVWEPDGAVTINRNLTITSGTFDIDGQNLTVTGTFSNIGTLRLLGTETLSLTSDTDSGTISYDNSASLTDFPSPLNDTYYNIIFAGTGTVTLAADLTASNDLTINSGAALNLNNFNVNVTGNLVNSGTLTQTSSSTITLNGTTQTFSPSNITLGAAVALTGSSGTASVGSNFTISNLLTIAAGRTLSLVSYVITLGSNLLTNLGIINEGSGYIAGTSSNFYIADSNFDEDSAISLAVDSVYISLTDQDANLNGQSADTLAGVVVSCATDSETVTLTETGAATEVFRNSGLPTALYAGSATDNNGTLTCADAATITATYTDPQDGTDTQSDTATATSDTVPTAPSSFAGTAASSTSITWTWTDNASNETGFKLYNSSNTLIATISTANTASYTETGLTASTSYTRKIVAYNGAGNSSYSSSASVTTDSGVTVPTAPSSFAGTSASNTSITWTWTDNASNETGFRLLDSAGATIATIATANTTSYTETDLTKNTSYTRKIVAYNGDGTSSASDTASVTTGNASPAQFSLISPADNALSSTGLPTFSFKKSSETGGSISSYTLFVGSLSFTGIPASGSASSNPATATDYENTYTAQFFSEGDSDTANDYVAVTLKDGSTSLPLPDGKYSWYVKAIDDTGNTTVSLDRTIIIDATAPAIGTLIFSGDTANPAVSTTVTDGYGLDEATVTLEKANTFLGAIASYTALETRTYSLSGKSQAISFTAKNSLQQGESYRYVFAVTDSAGHETSASDTHAVLSEQQIAQQTIATLNPDATPTETIVTTLRNALPKSPLNIPQLEAHAVVRRQLQAAQFSRLFAGIANYFRVHRGPLERQVAAWYGPAKDAAFGAARHVAAAVTGTGSFFTYRTHWLIALLFQGMHDASTALARIDVRTPLMRFANSITIEGQATGNALILAYNAAVAKSAAAVGTALNTAAHATSRVSIGGFVRQNLARGTHGFSVSRSVRISQGLANRQLIDGYIKKFIAPIKAQRTKIALKARAIYEIAFDKQPTKISNLAMTNLSPTSVTVTWDTNHVTRLGKVNYGTSTSYSQEAFEEDGLRDHHAVTLNNLHPDTTYYFEVMNQNGDYVYDAYYTITTPKAEENMLSLKILPQVAVIQGDAPVPAHEFADPTAKVVASLPPGAAYRALLQQDGWVSLLLDSGQEVWVLRSAVKLQDQAGISAAAQH